METHFSQKYRDHINLNNPLWRAIRVATLVLSCGRDCVNPLLKASQIDHLSYRSLKMAVPIEIPWIDVVPLHPFTHRMVTKLRAAGYAVPVNLVLRLGYGLWILAWIYSITAIVEALHGWHAIPLPLDLLRDVLSLYHAG
jgi:hypothetical protein